MLARLRAYAAHPDPLTAALNMLAVVLAANTPFYPLYLWAVLGDAATPVLLLTLCSLPFWASVPLIARRSGLAARIAICLIGTLNTLWCSAVLGLASGVALFLIPCVMLATLGFHHQERRIMRALAALPFLAYGVLRLWPPGPLAPPFTPAQHADLLTLNAVSVACLTFLLGLTIAAVRPTRLPDAAAAPAPAAPAPAAPDMVAPDIVAPEMVAPGRRAR